MDEKEVDNKIQKTKFSGSLNSNEFKIKEMEIENE
mgnify:CR=1 FL=1